MELIAHSRKPLAALRARVCGHEVGALLLGVILLALIVRVGWVLHDSSYRPAPIIHGKVVSTDAESYFHRGIYLYRHGSLARFGTPGRYKWADAYWPPLYVVFVAIAEGVHHHLASLGIPAIELIRLMQALIWSVAIGLLAMIGLRLFGLAVGCVAGVLAAVLPSLVLLGESLYSEALLVPLLIAAVWAVSEYRHSGRWWWLVAAGVLTGLGALTHSSGVYVVPPLVIALWPRGGLLLGARRRLRPLLPIVVFLASLAITLAPWTVRNELDLHHFIPVSTSLGNTLAGTYNNVSRTSTSNPAGWVLPQRLHYYAPAHRAAHRDGNPAVVGSIYEHLAIKFIERHPTYPFVVGFWNTARMLSLADSVVGYRKAALVGIDRLWSNIENIAFWVIGLLALAGCFTRTVRRGDKWIWAVPLFLYLGTVFISMAVPRSRSPMDPFFVLLAAPAVVALVGRLRLHLDRWRRIARGQYAST